MVNRFLILVCVVLSCVSVALAQPVRIVIRVDDIQSRNTTSIPRSIQPFEQAVTTRGGKVTWVTIPHRLIESQNTDGVLARELRASLAAGHEVAQHGHNHICTLCGNTGHEMWCATQSRGFPYSQQLGFVNSGKQILLDSLNVVPRTFVSPGHYEDTTTYAVLSASGFNAISTSRMPTGQVTSTLYNLPPGTDYTWQLTSALYRPNLTQALEDIRSAATSSGNYVVLFHDPFIRQGYLNGIVIQWTAELLDSLTAAYGQRLRILTLGNVIAQIRGGLPVQLASFSAHVVGNGVLAARWRTLTEMNNLGFQLQKRRTTNLWWTDLPDCFIPGHGTTSEPHDYLFVDSAASPGTWEYRLKQIDLDGMLHFSDLVRVDITAGIQEDAPREFALRQNFPNPFNPTTIIRYALPRDLHVRLQAFNTLGMQIATLANQMQTAGEHFVTFNSAALSSGVYFYRLEAGDFVTTRKMVVLR